MSEMMLFGIAGFVAMMMLLQALVFQVYNLPKDFSMYLALLAVFMTFLESKLDKIVDQLEILVWASIMLKTIKGMFTVTVFIVN